MNQKSLKEIVGRLKTCPSKTAILTDIDGTLYPIEARPEMVKKTDYVPKLLDELADVYEIVGVVTGRQIEQAKKMVPSKKILYVANHGLEFEVDGELFYASGVEKYIPVVEKAYKALTGNSELRVSDLIIENKGVTVAVHYRLVPEMSAKIGNIVNNVAEEFGLLFKTGRKVFELHPPVNVNKGTGITNVLDRAVNLALYAGDDVSDIDAFRALKNIENPKFESITLGVVSNEVSGLMDEPSIDYLLESPAQVVEILSMLIRADRASG